jgi:cell division protein FtsI (penicillin-binding protein 3)
MTAPAWRTTLRRRLATVVCLLGLWVAGIEARLVYLQVLSHTDLLARAERQQKRTQDMPAKRGDILDRRGRVLATSVDADSIYAVPTEISNPEDAAAKLCQALDDCSRKDRQALAERLNQQRAFAYVRRQVGPDVAKRVADLNLDGIGFLKESKRFYPNRELASHLLGWVGVDNTGLSGLEYTYDPYIRGKKGTILIQTDARRHAFSHVERPPTAGSTLELTIDENLQHIAERELHIGVLENHALSGSAIIMNPQTGEILAMANEPTFNPNAFRDADEDTRRNRAVQDLYEPGSTFKIVTVSAALEERVMPINALIDTNPGSIRLGSRVVTEARHHNYGVLSLSDVIVRSSNVGAIKIGFRVGTERLGRFVQRFGFGRPVSPDFPGESPGIVWDPAKWTDSALMSVSMGYQVGVTPLQMATAFSAVANGGELLEPRVVRAVYRDNRRLPVRPKVVRRAIAPDTANVLIGIMEGVVEDEKGTARAARIAGYSIAGKTGTANKLVNGRYSNDTFASFAGFLPSRNPALTIVVVLDSPRGANGHFGGVVSAPIFRRIAEASLRYLGIAPNVNAAPPVLVARRDNAEDAAPAPRVTLVTAAQSGSVPDVRGMSARDAVRTLFKVGLNAHLSGDGIVVSQMPTPGTPIETNTNCRLTLERSPRRTFDQVQP